MIVCGELRPSSSEDAALRKRSLRDAVICIGWLKIASIFQVPDWLSTVCFIVLFFFVHSNSKGKFSSALQIMIVAIIPFQVIHGVLLFLGALEEKTIALELGLWLCLLIGSYNTLLGIFGCIYFIRTGHWTLHFLLATTFALLALSLITVICHDIIIVHAFRESLLSQDHPRRVATNSEIGC